MRNPIMQTRKQSHLTVISSPRPEMVVTLLIRLLSRLIRLSLLARLVALRILPIYLFDFHIRINKRLKLAITYCYNAQGGISSVEKIPQFEGFFLL